ncbi:E3 ubiquitin-protein ligase mpsr1 [Thalictrum thalictroides]|uniref:RING-type E3 ubiquitin transferase n=1 Tax=Thalictrum thalictroides TaxID=46969 RepID=A0A7J6VDG5_THATH|nr:E3 ubiquitin-protein ligase mpsr1 [Thalictrum thalictroides]
MASNESADSFASFLEQLISSRNRDLSFFLPFILGISNSATTRRGERETESSDESDQEGSDNQQEQHQQTRDRIVLINPLTQGMIVIESSQSLEALLRELSNKDGPKPATKASIEAMPKIIITEEDEEKECSICLDGWEIGGEAREMPCKHRYHSNCIEKWLGIHGNCPVCRYKMPVDEEEETKKSSTTTTIVDSDEENRGGRRSEIWVSFSITGRRDSEDGNATED